MTFDTDFSEYTSDLAPSDWTEELNVGDGIITVRDDGDIGSKCLELDVTSAHEYYAASWDDVESPNDGEILAKFRFTAGASSIHYLFFILRGSGSDGSENFYDVNLTPNGNTFALHKIVNGSTDTLDSTSKTMNLDTWYWIRFQVIGTALKARFWADGASEPGTWDFEETDSDLSNGWVGTGYYSWNISDKCADIDYFAVGTDGNTAPSPA